MFKLSLLLVALLVLFTPTAMLAKAPVDADPVVAPMSHCAQAPGHEKQNSPEHCCVVACMAIVSRSFEMHRSVSALTPAPVARAAPFRAGSIEAPDPPPP